MRHAGAGAPVALPDGRDAAAGVAPPRGATVVGTAPRRYACRAGTAGARGAAAALDPLPL